MALNLLKMAVGIDDVPHLSAVQRQRIEQAKRERNVAELRHVTRHTPRRAGEILDGGSMFWIIKGLIRIRQPILRFDAVTREDGKPRCGVILDPALVPVEPRRHRPMQGWRYLESDRAPRDGDAPPEGDLADMPPEMARELRELGLL